MIFYIILSVLILIIWLLSFYFFYFLRKPNRFAPLDENIFVSPANWKIINIINSKDKKYVEIYKKHRKVLESFVKDMGDEVTIISIMMNLKNVHRQRSPNNAILISQEYQKWKFLNAIKPWERDDANFQNEYNSMFFKSTNGTKFKVVQIAWFLARRIEWFLEPNQSIKQWDVIWLIKLWSQVTIIFDNSVDINVKVWQVVIDWETILATKKTV